MSRKWTAKWIGRKDGDTFNPVFFKDFTIDFPISRATLYIAALGVYEAYINGQKVGNAYLTPFPNDGTGIPYDQFEVAGLLYAGPEAPANSIDIFLGQGWKEEDGRIAIRAEIVLERSGDPAAEALAMEFDEITAEPGEYEEDLFDLDDLDSFLDEGEEPFDDSDALLNELIGEEPFVDDAPELPELPEIMDMPDTLAFRETRPKKRHARKRLSVVQDPEMEEAGVLLADEEPVFEFISEPAEAIPSADEDLYSEDLFQELLEDSDFTKELPGEMPVVEPVMQEGLPNPDQRMPEEPPILDPLPNDIPVVQKAIKRRHIETRRLILPDLEPDQEESDRGFSDTMPSETAMSEAEIQAILAKQQKQMAASIPKFFEQPQEDDLFSEEDLESALQETGDFLLGESAFDEMDSLADELANEFGGEPAEAAVNEIGSEQEAMEAKAPAGNASDMTEQESDWYADVEGQVSFDFLGKIQEIMDGENAAKTAGEDVPQDDLEEALKEAGPDESRFNTKIFNGELESLLTELAKEKPEEGTPVEDFTEDLFDESILEDLPFEETLEERTEVKNEDLTEEQSEEAAEGGVEGKAEEAVAEEVVAEEAAMEETVAEEPPVTEEIPVKKKGLREHLKALDLAKKIGLTLGNREEEEPEAAERSADISEDTDAFDDMDLAKLDELGELLTDTNRLADMEAVMVGLNEKPKASAPAGTGFGGELPSFEDLFAAADDVGEKALKAASAAAIATPVILAGTKGTAEEESQEMAETAEEAPEPLVIIGTDETWGYYGSDIEENRIQGHEIFNRLLWNGKENLDRDAAVLELDIELTEAEEPLTVLEEMTVQSVIPAVIDADNTTGEWTLDFGKSFRGFVSFQSEVPEGTKITLTYMDTPTDETQDQQFVYISDGIQETVCSHFALFHGRYVKVTGWKGTMDASLFTGYRLMEENGEPEGIIVAPVGELTEEVAETAEETSAETDGTVEETVEELIEAATEETIEEPVEEASGEVREEAAEEVAEEVSEELDEAALDEELESLLEEEIEETVEETVETADETKEEAAEVFTEEAVPAIGLVSTSEERLNQIVAEQQEKLNEKLEALDAFAAGEDGASDTEKISIGDMCALIQTAAPSGNIKESAMKFFGKLREVKIAEGNAAETSVMDRAEAVKAIWSLYESYGDVTILEENYDLIKDALASVKGETYIVNAPKLADDDTDPSFVATASYYEMAKTAAKAAKVLQKEEDEKQFADQAGSIKEAFLDEFFSRSGRLAEDTQTAYILALKSGLCDNQEKLKEDFLKQLKKDQYQLKCGKAGRNMLPFVLADCGESELAYRYLMNDWAISDEAGNVNDRTAEFLTKYVNGIKTEEPGFTKVKIAPVPNFRLIDSAGMCVTPQGNIVSDWDVNDEGQIHFHFEIPEGCEAHVVLPDCDDDAIKEQTLSAGIYNFNYMPTKDYLHLFGENSMIGDLLKYDESIAIIEEADTSLAEQIQTAGADLLTKTLDDLPVDAEVLSGLKEKLFELK